MSSVLFVTLQREGGGSQSRLKILRGDRGVQKEPHEPLNVLTLVLNLITDT